MTQYTLALDREAQGLDRYLMPYHEAVFMLIRMTVESAHRQGIRAAVCGQLAADEKVIERLMAEGVDEVSVPVKKIYKIKKMIN